MLYTVPKGPLPSLAERFSEIQHHINDALERLLPAPQEGSPASPLFQAMRYAVLTGGKRLRPFLVIESARLFNVSSTSALRAACGIELIHAFSLIHDDLPCMDNADLRRGKPSTHIAFDEATAVLAGDAMLALAFEILSEEETCSDPLVRNQLVAMASRAVGPLGMCCGQMMDISMENHGADMDTILRMLSLKTGRLLNAACLMGATLGRAPHPAQVALSGYAHDMGLAYQITDDLLDVEGLTDEIGKPIGTDASLGKANLVTFMGPAQAREHAAMLVKQALTHLDYFGDKAHYLMEFAKGILNRRS